MEGKALLFKLLGGVDAVPLCIRAREPGDVLRAAKLIEPSFGAINLEDIAQPRCFRILEAARAELAIPVWHDDQQGTATVVLAGLVNALALLGKTLERLRIVMFGMGAANVAVYRLLVAAGAEPGAIVACDSTGVLHRGRGDIAGRQQELAEKWRVCTESNAEGVTGGPAEAFRGAEVCLAFSRSGPGLIRAEWIESMAADAIVFACANPAPEIWPWEAHAAGARIVATGRSDFPNQVNNSLGFPGIFRGVLDVRARAITDEMAMAAAQALAAHAEAQGLRDDAILPPMGDWEVAARIAAATGLKAQEQGLAALALDGEALYQGALARIRNARDSLDLLTREGLIPAPPPAPSGI
jgi:malate dehydrogenase (oxaloacetate-decarboxylating)